MRHWIEISHIIADIYHCFLKRRVEFSFLLVSIPSEELLDVPHHETTFKFILCFRGIRHNNRWCWGLWGLGGIDSFHQLANSVMVLKHALSLLVTIDLRLVSQAMNRILKLIVLLNQCSVRKPKVVLRPILEDLHDSILNFEATLESQTITEVVTVDKE
jgi:hypothetical protein